MESNLCCLLSAGLEISLDLRTVFTVQLIAISILFLLIQNFKLCTNLLKCPILDMNSIQNMQACL